MNILRQLNLHLLSSPTMLLTKSKRKALWNAYIASVSKSTSLKIVVKLGSPGFSDEKFLFVQVEESRRKLLNCCLSLE